MAAIGYSSLIPWQPIIPGVPEARLALFDNVFKTHYAGIDMAIKIAMVETIDQKLINGTEVEHHEILGEMYVAVLDA